MRLIFGRDKKEKAKKWESDFKVQTTAAGDQEALGWERGA